MAVPRFPERGPRQRSLTIREDRWYVARTLQHGERVAEENLKNQAFGVFLPMWTPDRTTKTGKAPAQIPLFPGYILVQFDIAFDTNWPAINNTRGVKRLLPLNRERPIPIPDAFVERIRKRVVAGDFEPDEIEDIVARFTEGLVVDIVAGPFAGFSGQFQRRRGADLEFLVDIFGRQTPVTLALDQVEHPAPPVVPEAEEEAA